MKQKTHHKYSEEEKEFLRREIGGHSYKELAEMLRNEFGSDVDASSVSDLCTKRMRIKREQNTGRFVTETVRSYSCPIGTEVMRCGYWHVKIDNIRHAGTVRYKKMKDNWIPKHRLVYERAFGRIPDGKIVIFLDGDINNFALSNLYCIDRGLHAMMSKNKWYTTNRDATMAAIRLCELRCVIKES